MSGYKKADIVFNSYCSAIVIEPFCPECDIEIYAMSIMLKPERGCLVQAQRLKQYWYTNWYRLFLRLAEPTDLRLQERAWIYLEAQEERITKLKRRFA